MCGCVIKSREILVHQTNMCHEHEVVSMNVNVCCNSPIWSVMSFLCFFFQDFIRDVMVKTIFRTSLQLLLKVSVSNFKWPSDRDESACKENLMETLFKCRPQTPQTKIKTEKKKLHNNYLMLLIASEESIFIPSRQSSMLYEKSFGIKEKRMRM